MKYTTQEVYLSVYLLSLLYFFVLGCIMLAQRGDSVSTHGELIAKKRMTRSVGFFMFFWSFDWLIYLVPVLLHNFVPDEVDYSLCFIFTMMLDTPLLYFVMHAILQKKGDTLRWTSAIGLPFLILFISDLLIPHEVSGRIPEYLSAALNIAFIVFLFFRYAKEYRAYVRRIHSEYSELSGRDIIWSWSCFSGFAAQSVIFILYIYYWQPFLELLYLVLSLVNAAYLCYCTYRQKPLDLDVVEEAEPEVVIEEKHEEKAFYSIIEQKLKSLCEGKLLFLEPDLTRETLCRHISVSSTYLKMYFHSRGLSFYQYINTLRVEYAYKLMQENPDMPIRDVSDQSGFRSQTTFRKMFKEVKGCLPSELKRKE